MCCADWESPHWRLLWAVFTVIQMYQAVEPAGLYCHSVGSLVIFIFIIDGGFSNIVIARWFCPRVLPGSMWEPTSHSSQSLSGLPARFGPSPETVLPSTGVLSPHRAQQVSGSKTAIGNAVCERASCVIFSVVCPSAGDSWYHIPSPSRQKLKQVSVGRTSVHAVDENGKATAHLISSVLIQLFWWCAFLSRKPLVPTGRDPQLPSGLLLGPHL